MRKRELLAAAAVAIQAQRCVLSRQPVTPLGRTVAVHPAEHEFNKLAGELMAVSAESLWLQRADATGIVSIPLSAIRTVRFRRSTLGAGAALGYSALLGLVTGAALAGACASVEDAECGGIFPAFFFTSMIVGGLSALSLESNTKVTITPGQWDALRRHARFPQGMPEGIARRGLLGGRRP